MTKKIFRLLFFFFVILFLVIRYFHAEYEIARPQTNINECDEYEEADTVRNLRTQYRSWLEYASNENYCTEYQFSSSLADDSFTFRESLQVNDQFSEVDFWREVYSSLYQRDQDKMIYLQDSLLQIQKKYQLDKDEFARMVVSFVQDIPYNYIDQGDCRTYTDQPCTAFARFGILSPVEFLFTLKGDCDTRTVLLYTLLRNFGYDPLIINSREYQHSMLALDIPASGESFAYKGRTYSYWETTNVGWQPGMLPPEMSNKNYWFVALDYEYKTDLPGNY